uniref:Uncharacterized protein n=1 Tax=Oryza glumipatula TaxID=40148 RepID=A0A0D9ZDD5_9ORYZ
MAPSPSSSHSPLPTMMASAPSLPRADAMGSPGDLNHSDIAGYMPPELGLLADLALLYLNSNRFCASSRQSSPAVAGAAPTVEDGEDGAALQLRPASGAQIRSSPSSIRCHLSLLSLSSLLFTGGGRGNTGAQSSVLGLLPHPARLLHRSLGRGARRAASL